MMLQQQNNTDEDNKQMTILFSPGGQAVLQACHHNQQIGQFGIMMQAGPSTPELEATVRSIYGRTQNGTVRAAAIL